MLDVGFRMELRLGTPRSRRRIACGPRKIRPRSPALRDGPDRRLGGVARFAPSRRDGRAGQ